MNRNIINIRRSGRNALSDQDATKAPSTYQIGTVSSLTGVDAHTIRAWERRYGLPDPERTVGRHRLYSQYDIEVIKWLVARQEEGLSISGQRRL